MKYYLYHIPGKKIGVTCDIYNRVTDQQGYEEDEYEILESSEEKEVKPININQSQDFENYDF